jgi:hypothetical protein
MIAARPAAAPCAAGYAWGEDGSNQCPTSYYAIDTAAACESAATAVGKTFFGGVTYTYHPSGCYLYQFSGNLFFNADALGAGYRGTQLLCSGAARSRTRRLRHHGILWYEFAGCYGGTQHSEYSTDRRGTNWVLPACTRLCEHWSAAPSRGRA